MSRAVQIVHLVPADGLGGVETAARSLAEHPLLSRDFRLVFMFGETLAVNSARVDASGGSSRYNPLSFWNAFRRLVRLRPDVLVCSLWRTVPIGVAVKLFSSSTALVYFIHNSRTEHFADRWLSWLGLRVADEVWCDSGATLAARSDIPAKVPARVISFVTQRRDVPIASPLSARFVSWGRLNSQKGLDRAIRLIAKLKDRDIDAMFEAWGPDDGEKPALDTLAHRVGVADRITFPGLTSPDRLPAIAARHSFFLQLSRYEGMAMAVVEAMQLGLVPITTEVGQMAHYVRPGETGLLIEPSDLDSAADEIAALLQKPDQFRRLADGATRYWRDAPLYAEDVTQAAFELKLRLENHRQRGGQLKSR